MGEAAENVCHIDGLIDTNRDIVEVQHQLDELEREFQGLVFRRKRLLEMRDVLHERKRALLEGRPPPVFG